jgi:hypothetical protein
MAARKESKRALVAPLNQWLAIIQDSRKKALKPKPEGFSDVYEIAKQLGFVNSYVHKRLKILFTEGKVERDWFHRNGSKAYCYRIK